jgi:diguanylate cyclase (GGDEF)-like protein
LVGLIRQVASPAHPLVMFLDDLQWADQPSLDFMAALLEDTTISGLLLIGAYRDNEVDASHKLTRLIRQPTSSGMPPAILTLTDLAIPDLTSLLSDMLRTPAALVHPLATALHAKTGGNPFFTVAFINRLYRDGVVRPDPEHGRWVWDDAVILAHGASANVIELLAAGLATLPAKTTDILAAAACLGHHCTLGALAQATNMAQEDVTSALLPALERGLVITPDSPAFHRAEPDTKLHFCHDRVQQAVYELRDETARTNLHLAIARRFVSAGGHDARDIRAAEHYAAAAALIEAPAERAAAQRLFHAAALQARQAGSFATAERFFRLGIAMLGDDPWDHGADAAFAMHAGLHITLYSQSDYAEADAAYAVLEQHAAAPVDLVDATCVQIASLASRNLYEAAVTLGSAALTQLGIAMPHDDAERCHAEELAAFYRLAESGALERLPGLPRLSDAALLGAATLMSRLEPSAAFGARTALARWLDLRTVRLCIEHGLCDAAMPSLCRVLYSAVPARGDYATGYRAARIALTMAQAAHAGTEAAHALRLYAAAVSHWFHPVSDNITHARTAFDRLVRAGDMEMACFTFGTSLVALMESGNGLCEMEAEIEAALRFARKTRNRESEQAYLPLRQCVHALRGITDTPGAFDDAEFNEPAYLASVRGNTMALGFFHVYRAMTACLFNDQIGLRRHAHAVQSAGPSMIGSYRSMLANFLQSLALVEEIRQAPKTAQSGLGARLAANQAWLAARAADAPMNFAHLHDLVEAERLDVLEDAWAAAEQLYEMAMRRAEANQRLWHRALLTEKAGRAHLRRGLDHSGRALLWQAHDLYARWGANGKISALRDEFPFIAIGGAAGPHSDKAHAAGYLSLLGAGQALALETSLPRLVGRVVELLAQLTGATAVRLLLLDDAGRWHLEGMCRDGKAVDVDCLPPRQAEEQGLLPASALRLALRTLKPLLADDAVIDIRFKDDPHFKDMPRCALLALPVFVQGRVSALLILESTLYRSAFSTTHIETLSLLCGQLSICIANLRLRQSLESKVAERTRELEAANQQLQQLSHLDALTGIANRRMFDTVWRAESRQAARDKRPLAVLLIDVDHFKAYNDAYGHQAGDACLQTVAGALAAALRRGADLVARYGGEEFAVVLPGLTVPEALRMAQTLRIAVMDCAITHIRNSVAPIVTVSIGVAGWVPEAGAEPIDLLADADAALYEAKHSGRNQCVALAPP